DRGPAPPAPGTPPRAPALQSLQCRLPRRVGCRAHQVSVLPEPTPVASGARTAEARDMYSTHRLRAATIRRSFFTVLIVLVLCGRGASPARASEIVDPDQQGVSATSYYPTFGQIPSKMTDNSGLSRALPTGSA